MALMTIADVITAAYTRNIATSQLKTTDIDIAEFQYIRPALTENLYNAVVADTATYATLINTYIKPCLAYFVKYITIENIFVEVSDRGLNHLNSDNATTVGSQQRTDYKTEVLNKANILLEKLVDYVTNQYHAANTLYSLYNNNQNVYEEDKLIGGFLILNNKCNENNINDSDGSNHERYLGTGCTY
jgi:hypothetical protein